MDLRDTLKKKKTGGIENESGCCVDP
jgi:hypothetical protein